MADRFFLCTFLSDSRDVMNGHRARVFAIQYHPVDPHVFVTGGWDDTVQVMVAEKFSISLIISAWSDNIKSYSKIDCVIGVQ